jgi:hypothetical protein
VLSAQESPITLQVEAACPTQTAASLGLRVEAHTNTPGLQQGVDFWDWTTSAWVVVDTRNASPNTDMTIVANGQNPNRFIQSGTRAVRARVRFKQNGPVFNQAWEGRFDQIQWVVTN